MMGLVSCGSDSSDEAKELLQKILNLVGIPQAIVVNICQDENKDGICGATELQAKITITKDDSVATIWEKITNTANGEYLLETYDATLPILLELQDVNSEYYTDKFTLPFSGLKSTEDKKDLSILQAMVDAGYLTADEIVAVKEMDNQEIFYETLLKDFEINLNTLTEQNISTPKAVLTNIKEMAEGLKEAGITEELPKKIDSCEDNDSCVEEAVEETVIDEDEAETIQDNETTQHKKLLASKVLYHAYSEQNQIQIEKISFNSEVDTLSWEVIQGVEKDEKGVSSIEINGNQLIVVDDTTIKYLNQTDDFLLYENSNGEKKRFFFDKKKAEAYYNSSNQ